MSELDRAVFVHSLGKGYSSVTEWPVLRQLNGRSSLRRESKMRGVVNHWKWAWCLPGRRQNKIQNHLCTATMKCRTAQTKREQTLSSRKWATSFWSMNSPWQERQKGPRVGDYKGEKKWVSKTVCGKKEGPGRRRRQEEWRKEEEKEKNTEHSRVVM